MAQDHDEHESDEAALERDPAAADDTAGDGLDESVGDEPATTGAMPRSAARRTARRPEPSEDDGPVRRAPSGTIRTVLATVVVLALVAVSVLVYLQTRALDAERQRTADRARAEQIASDYAVKAANLDYRDMTPWVNALKTGATPELAKKYDQVADLLKEVITPLRLVSSGKAAFAKTGSEVNGIYQVKVAVDVSTETYQTPQGSSNTTTYSITLDKNRDWVITQMGDPANPESVFGSLGGLGGGAGATPSTAPSAPATPAVPAFPEPSGTPN